MISIPNSPPENIDLSTVPETYHDLRQVFSKEKALTLPPYHPQDCAIDLLPTRRVYNLTKPEKEAMEVSTWSTVAAHLLHIMWQSVIQ